MIGESFKRNIMDKAPHNNLNNQQESFKKNKICSEAKGGKVVNTGYPPVYAWNFVTGRTDRGI